MFFLDGDGVGSKGVRCTPKKTKGLMLTSISQLIQESTESFGDLCINLRMFLSCKEEFWTVGSHFVRFNKK